jgi:lysine biosynthesis protein LysW
MRRASLSRNGAPAWHAQPLLLRVQSRGTVSRVKMRAETQEVTMSRCPECDSDLELDGYDVDVGETIHCPECSVELKVTSLDPIEVTLAEEEERR